MTNRLTVPINPLALAAMLDILSNIAAQLETRVDPLQVAQQIRGFIAQTESDARALDERRAKP